MIPFLVSLVFVLNLLPSGTSFLPCEISSSKSRNQYSRRWQSEQNGDQKGDNDQKESLNPLLKLPWYAVESFGNLFAFSKEDNISSLSSSALDFTKTPSSLDETIQRIQLDNERNYFLSGEVDKLCYAKDCIFSDPFVSFEGRDRFVANLQNLGSFVTQYDVKQLKYNVIKTENKVDMKVMVKLELNLPWKPVLAWPWGVVYDIDPETHQITGHAESWDIEPLEGVKQIFRKPTARINK